MEFAAAALKIKITLSQPFAKHDFVARLRQTIQRSLFLDWIMFDPRLNSNQFARSPNLAMVSVPPNLLACTRSVQNLRWRSQGISLNGRKSDHFKPCPKFGFSKQVGVGFRISIFTINTFISSMPTLRIVGV
jgi:hypothetical protein